MALKGPSVLVKHNLPLDGHLVLPSLWIGDGPYADFGRHHPGDQGTTLLSYPVRISASGVPHAALSLPKALHL